MMMHPDMVAARARERAESFRRDADLHRLAASARPAREQPSLSSPEETQLIRGIAGLRRVLARLVPAFSWWRGSASRYRYPTEPVSSDANAVSRT
jgi:hypothetical protein